MTNLVTSNDKLKTVCERANRRAFVMLDTEFVRTRTLYPQLGLIQLNDGDSISLIDPIAISDFEPLLTLFSNPQCLKVLHSCSEDFEAFNHTFNVIPSPVFDTQFAAGLAGMGHAVGYANLVEKMLDVTLDKGESRTNWLARPLRDKQLEYAANDVLYLYSVYQQLSDQLSDEFKQIVVDEMQMLREKKQTILPLEQAYLRVKNKWRLNGKQLHVLKSLAAWRLNIARERDISINFVLKENAMFALAEHMPTNFAGIQKISSLDPHSMRRHSKSLIRIISESINAESTDYPRAEKRLSQYSEYKSKIARMKELVNETAANIAVEPQIIASKKQLHQVLEWHWFNETETRIPGFEPDMLRGWRGSYLKDKIDALFTVKK